MYPFFWPREAAAAGAAAMRLGIGLAETALASSQVIGRRLPIIGDACADPRAADHRELALMVTEKAEAFSRAGWSLGQAALAAQLDMAQQWSSFLVGGASPARLRQAQDRAVRSAARNLSAAGEALAPVRKAATANARRLAGKRRRPKAR